MRNRRGIYRILVGKSGGKNHYEDPGIDGRLILNGSLGSGMGVIHWIDLTQDRDRWRALVNVVRNIRVPQNVGNFLTS
jgi:hypothetical protein